MDDVIYLSLPTVSEQDLEMAIQLVQLTTTYGVPSVSVDHLLPPAVRRTAEALGGVLDELHREILDLGRRARAATSVRERLRLAEAKATLIRGYVACAAEPVAALRTIGATLQIGVRRPAPPPEEAGVATIRLGW